MGGRFGGSTDGSSAYEDRRPPLEDLEDEHEEVMEALEQFRRDLRREDSDDTTDSIDGDATADADSDTDTGTDSDGDEDTTAVESAAVDEEDGMEADRAKRVDAVEDSDTPQSWHEAVQQREGYNNLLLNEYADYASGGSERHEREADEFYDEMFGRIDELGPLHSERHAAADATQQSTDSAETTDLTGDGDSFGTSSLAASSGVLDEIGGVDYADLEESGEAGTSSSASDVRTDRSGLDTTLGSQRKAEMHRLERGTDIAGGYDWDKDEPVSAPDPDPRDSLSGEELGAVNDAASDLAGKHEDATQAEISHQLAGAVESGDDVATAAAELDDGLADGSVTLESPPGQSDDPRHRRTRIQQEEIEADFDHLQQIHNETAEGVNTGERASIAHATNEQARISPREVLPNAPDSTGSYKGDDVEEQWGEEGRENIKRGIRTIRQGFEDETVEIQTETENGHETVETTLRTGPVADAAVEQLTEEIASGLNASHPPRRAVSEIVSELDSNPRLNDVFDASGYDAREYLSSKETETVTEAVDDLEENFPQLATDPDEAEQRLAGMIVDKGYTESDALVMDTVRDATDSGEMAWTKDQIEIDQYYTPLMDTDLTQRDTALRTGKRDKKYSKDQESDFQYLGHKFQASSQYIGRDDATGQPQYRADVEGRVNGLKHPDSPSQHQVGWLSSPEGHPSNGTPLKVTWFKSSGMDDKVIGRSGDAPEIVGSRDYLRVGDRVRFSDATVSQYDGANGSENTVAVREVTQIEILEEGDGDIIHGGMGMDSGQPATEQPPDNHRDVVPQKRDEPDPGDFDTIEAYWDEVGHDNDTRRPADADTVTAERTVVSDDWAFTPDDLGERDGVETSVSANGGRQYTATGREHGRPTGNPYQAAEHKEREKERRRGKQYQDSRDSYHEYQRKRWDIPEEVYESGEAEQREGDKESRRNGYRRDAQEQFGYTDTQVHADLPWPGNETERRPQRPASDTTPAHRPDVDSKQLPSRETRARADVADIPGFDPKSS
jgi:hypothetical protein